MTSQCDDRNSGCRQAGYNQVKAFDRSPSIPYEVFCPTKKIMRLILERRVILGAQSDRPVLPLKENEPDWPLINTVL